MPYEHGDSANLLRAYLDASDDQCDEALGELLSRKAEPLIQAIVRSKLGRSRAANPADVEDVCSESALALVASLQEFRNVGEKEPIADFDAFVSVVAYRAYSAFFRRTQPEFHRLRNRLRYLLESRKGMAIWEDAYGVWWCSLEAWRNQTPAGRATLDEIAAASVAADDPEAVVRRVLNAAAAPVSLDDLVCVMAELWGVAQPKLEEPDRLACPSPSTELRLEQRQWIERLWEEIRELPARQRSALLLNLRDPVGESVTTLLALTRVASLSQIAETLEMTAEAFAAVWKELPWSDKRIAGFLGMNGQQVINLRKSARERLWRRMRSEKLSSVRVW